jgi:hypothetical protein
MEKRKVSARELKQPIVKSEDLSAALKRLAAERPIRVALTEEQYRGLLGTWNEKDPTRPAQITFVVGDRSVGRARQVGTGAGLRPTLGPLHEKCAAYFWMQTGRILDHLSGGSRGSLATSPGPS